MELTLKRLLEQAEFKKFRGKGYDPADVDDFLDKAAAMAAKVEVQLTQAMEQAANAGAPGGEAVDVEAEVERRVAARLAEQSSGSSATAEEDMAEEVRRTIVLAQRTADAAVREAREDADKILTSAKEQAETLVADAQARANALDSDATARAEATRAEVEAEATRERREARQRLAAEIAELEGVRESLRSDVNVLERHVEEQRIQLGSTLAELQQVLDDPSGFRLAPVPALLDPEVPDLSDAFDEQPESAAPVEAEPEPTATSEPDAMSAAAAEAEVDAEPEPATTSDESTTSAPAAVPLTFDEIDHAAPGVDDAEAPSVDAGPPTAPVSAVDLGLAPEPDAPSDAGDDDDAFLAELRKAMADDEPLGPRDADLSPRGEPFYDDEDDRRGRRFGRRR